MSTMTTEHKQKIVQAKAQRAVIRDRRFTVAGFDLYRFDPLNWCVEPTGNESDDRRAFYPTFAAGALALFHRITDNKAEAAQDLKAVLDAIKTTEQAILAVVTY